MSGEWQVEMLWRCAACHHENLGRHVECQRCGKPKTGAEAYEMPSDTSEANAVRDADRVVTERGESAEARWPAPGEVMLGAGGQKEREQRDARYEVRLAADGQSYTLRPATAEELARFGLGSTHVLRVHRDGRVTRAEGDGGR